MSKSEEVRVHDELKRAILELNILCREAREYESAVEDKKVKVGVMRQYYYDTYGKTISEPKPKEGT